MIRHTLEILQQLLQGLLSVADHSGTLRLKGLNSLKYNAKFEDDLLTSAIMTDSKKTRQKVLLKILENLKENTCVGVSFYSKNDNRRISLTLTWCLYCKTMNISHTLF